MDGALLKDLFNGGISDLVDSCQLLLERSVAPSPLPLFLCGVLEMCGFFFLNGPRGSG